jgi:hypothetical protein
MLPDFGCYNGPERVADAFIGLESIDIMEDVVLLCDKKSEVSVFPLTRTIKVRHVLTCLVYLGSCWHT